MLSRVAGLTVPGGVRVVAGVGCVAVAATTLVFHVGGVVTAFDAQVSSDAYITNEETRLLTTGDALGIPYELQAEALALIPKDATYTLLLPPNLQAATQAGINALTFDTVGAFLTYLLLPAQPAISTPAGYLICYGCDRRAAPTATRWLWQDGNQAIGRVSG